MDYYKPRTGTMKTPKIPAAIFFPDSPFPYAASFYSLPVKGDTLYQSGRNSERPGLVVRVTRIEHKLSFVHEEKVAYIYTEPMRLYSVSTVVTRGPREGEPARYDFYALNLTEAKRECTRLFEGRWRHLKDVEMRGPLIMKGTEDTPYPLRPLHELT